jgi:hypothetical protein
VIPPELWCSARFGVSERLEADSFEFHSTESRSLSQHDTIRLDPKFERTGVRIDAARNQTVGPVVLRKNEHLNPFLGRLRDREDAAELDHAPLLSDLDWANRPRPELSGQASLRCTRARQRVTRCGVRDSP